MNKSRSLYISVLSLFSLFFALLVFMKSPEKSITGQIIADLTVGVIRHYILLSSRRLGSYFYNPDSQGFLRSFYSTRKSRRCDQSERSSLIKKWKGETYWNSGIILLFKSVVARSEIPQERSRQEIKMN